MLGFYLMKECVLMLISIINGDLTAECSRPIELIELGSFSHNHTKKHNFQLIIKMKIHSQSVGLIVLSWYIPIFVLQLLRYVSFSFQFYYRELRRQTFILPELFLSLQPKPMHRSAHHKLNVCVSFCIRRIANCGHSLAQKVPLDLESK